MHLFCGVTGRQIGPEEQLHATRAIAGLFLQFALGTRKRILTQLQSAGRYFQQRPAGSQAELPDQQDSAVRMHRHNAGCAAMHDDFPLCLSPVG